MGFTTCRYQKERGGKSFRRQWEGDWGDDAIVQDQGNRWIKSHLQVSDPWELLLFHSFLTVFILTLGQLQILLH